MGQIYDVIIIGGSVSGLSAGLTLGRSLRKVLIIDSDQPCNRQTPHSYNFITQDGKTPQEINKAAQHEVMKYEGVTFLTDIAVDAKEDEEGFAVTTKDNGIFHSKKIVLATGLNDVFPEIPGFAECWGISVLHCPYCHGYEVKNEKTVVLASGLAAYHLSVLLHNWTRVLTVLTNGESGLSDEELKILKELNVQVVEKPIESITQNDGLAESVNLADGTSIPTNVIYASIPFEQQSKLAEKLGCTMTEKGHIETDNEQRTTVEGVYAIGDCTAQQRAISVAAASGTKAAFTINLDLVLRLKGVRT
ncbi:MAG TPA: NAD(P)/FAD-dependent oxidoreductase [Flavobacterium sp.]|jgi:thioredoxin reductase